MAEKWMCILERLQEKKGRENAHWRKNVVMEIPKLLLQFLGFRSDRGEGFWDGFGKKHTAFIYLK